MGTAAECRTMSGFAAACGQWAADCLRLEIATHPKPGLVSHLDNGAHADMDAALLGKSAAALEPYFTALAAAGAADAEMDRLRAIGRAAERAMLTATGGVNTHRGAIFGLGLLAAAAGLRRRRGGAEALGEVAAGRWGDAIRRGPALGGSHGQQAARRFGVGGARGEAVAGFPTVYRVGLPGLADGEAWAGGEGEAARVQACFALIAATADTNLLHRGGTEGLAFARRQAAAFLAAGGVGEAGWRDRAERVHERFVHRRLSPGGAADLLAMTLFVRRIEGGGP